jgi:SAM-dependent methyltransferase
MLSALGDNAARLGLEPVHTVQADAESLPFADESFDLVLGHAILHHIPDLDRAFTEFHRVLRPGGRLLFAGEPSHLGDRLARVPKRAAVTAAPLWRRLLKAAPAPDADEDHGHELEGEVDIHAFRPTDLKALADAAGFDQVHVSGEELVANWFGWFNRGLEASASAEDVPLWWRRYAFHGYLALQRLDSRLLEPRLPAAIFYNLLLTGRRPR